MKLCIEKHLPESKIDEAVKTALLHNPKNLPRFVGVLQTLNVPIPPQSLMRLIGKSFTPGTTLSVYFYGGSPSLRAKILKAASEWSLYGNIDFSETQSPMSAQIRVEFAADNQSYSYIGTDSLHVDGERASMHYGWIDDTTDMEEIYRTATHEFGHGLGFGHEWQSPARTKSGLRLNLAAIRKTFGGPPNDWSDEEIKSQIIDVMAAGLVESSTFDIKSIMEYWYPSECVIPPTNFPMNTRLSDTDKAMVGDWYPGRVTTPGSPPSPPPPMPPTHPWPTLSWGIANQCPVPQVNLPAKFGFFPELDQLNGKLTLDCPQSFFNEPTVILLSHQDILFLKSTNGSNPWAYDVTFPAGIESTINVYPRRKVMVTALLSERTK